MDDSIKCKLVCRCCLTDSDHEIMKDMFRDAFESQAKQQTIHFYEGFTYQSGIELRPADDGPHMICRTCEDKLKVSYDFKNLCHASDQTLKERGLLVEVKEETYDSGDDKLIVYAEQSDVMLSPERTFSQVFVAEPTMMKIENLDVQIENDSEDEDGDRDQDYSEEEEEVKISKKSPRTNGKRKKPKPDSKPIDQAALEGNFICHTCDQFFDLYQDCKDHKASHIHDLGVKYIKRVCKLCNEMVDGYLKHIKHKHKTYRPNTCRTCGKGYQRIYDLQSHLLTHVDGRSFGCKGCKQKYQNSKKLKYHIVRTKHSKNMYHCPDCGLGSSTFALFLEHFKTHKNDVLICRNLYPCFFCKNIFFRQSHAREHDCDPTKPVVMDIPKSKRREPKKKKIKIDEASKAEEDQKEKPHKCDRCPLSFNCEDELICHQHSLCTGKKSPSSSNQVIIFQSLPMITEEDAAVRDIKSFFCKICNIEFRSNILKNSHMRNLHEDRKIVCDQCGYKCITESKLISHKVVHMTDRTWKCPSCPLLFKDQKGWRTHQQSHEEKNYECHLCGKFYRSLPTIRLHINLRHDKSQRKYECEVCDKTFVREAEKARHMVSHQGKIANCEICGKVYSDKKSLRHHNQFVHQGLRYECYVCQQVLSSKKIMYEHLFLHRGFKPFNCPECLKPFLTRQRFIKHIITHNIKFDEKTHGFREPNKNVFKIVDACAVVGGEKLSANKIEEMMDLMRLTNLETRVPPSDSVLISDYDGMLY